MANSQLFYTQVMTAKESAWGTPVARTVSHPTEQPQFQPAGYRHIVDTGFRNAAGLEFDLLPGPGEGNFQWGGNYFVDSTTALLFNMFGGTDAVTGANPYTHAIPSSKAPPSMTVEWGNNNQAYLFAGGRLSQFTLNFNGRDGTLTYTCQGQSKIGATTAQTSFTIGSVSSLTGWQGSISIAGSGVAAALLEGSITFTRGLKIIHGLAATQDVSNIYALPLQVGANLTFDFSDTITYNYFATAAATTKNAVVLTFTQSSNAILVVTMTKAGWRMVTPTANDNIYTAAAQINGIYNATDVGPAALSVTNVQAAAYSA